MKRRDIIADSERSLERQAIREYAVPSAPDGFELQRLKCVDADIPSGTSGEAEVMLPAAEPGVYTRTTTRVPVYVLEGTGAISLDDEFFAYWHGGIGKYVKFASGAATSPFLAKITAELPARTADDEPGSGLVQPVKLDDATGKLVDDGPEKSVYTWTGVSSGDPADDPKGYIYVWIETRGSEYWWTGQDCVDTSDPVVEEPSPAEIASNANLVIVTQP